MAKPVEAAGLALILPRESALFRKELQAVLEEFRAAGEPVVPVGLHCAETEFDKILALCRDYSQGRNLPAGHVPATTWWLVPEDESRILGAVSIRHSLNEKLLQEGGHIGYGVRPSQRRKGYATRMLSMALDLCAGMGIDPALVTCDADNIASARTIERNGGKLEDERECGGRLVRRYWIATIPQDNAVR